MNDIIVSFESIKAELEKRIEEQTPKGSFPAGFNGAYGDEETPVRNTAHLLYALCSVYEISGEEKFLISAKSALEFLLNNEFITSSGYYLCRLAKNKDSSNGVIGHAWIIEALLKANDVLTSKDAFSKAYELWKLHKFNYKLGIWAIPGNTNLPVYDKTFNHQLWFAACSAEFRKKEVDDQIERFIEINLKNMDTYEDGVIYHHSFLGTNLGWLRENFVSGLRATLSVVKYRRNKRKKRLHSVGYHAFNLYAISMLLEGRFKQKLKSVIDIDRIVSVVESQRFISELENYSEIGYGYNPSGIEIAYIYSVLDGRRDKVNQWLKRQQTVTCNEKGFLLNKSPDKMTSKARLYEIFRVIK